MDKVTTIGLDLAKHVFQVHGVEMVMVNGDIVVRNGAPTRVDEAAILEEAMELAKADSNANAEYVARAEFERPALQALITEALQRETSVRRHVQL